MGQAGRSLAEGCGTGREVTRERERERVGGRERGREGGKLKVEVTAVAPGSSNCSSPESLLVEGEQTLQSCQLSALNYVSAWDLQSSLSLSPFQIGRAHV